MTAPQGVDHPHLAMIRRAAERMRTDTEAVRSLPVDPGPWDAVADLLDDFLAHYGPGVDYPECPECPDGFCPGHIEATYHDGRGSCAARVEDCPCIRPVLRVAAAYLGEEVPTC